MKHFLNIFNEIIVLLHFNSEGQRKAGRNFHHPAILKIKVLHGATHPEVALRVGKY